MSHTSTRDEGIGALHFAGKFIAILVLVMTVLWVIGRAFAFSRTTGFLALGVLAMFLYRSAHRWIDWLPGLLTFSVISSTLMLVTGKARDKTVAPEVALLLGIFYLVGCLVAYRYDTKRLTPVDRSAFVIYLAAMILPAFVAGSDLSKVSPGLAWSVLLGVTALLLSFLLHIRKRGYVPVAIPEDRLVFRETANGKRET